MHWCSCIMINQLIGIWSFNSHTYTQVSIAHSVVEPSASDRESGSSHRASPAGKKSSSQPHKADSASSTSAKLPSQKHKSSSSKSGSSSIRQSGTSPSHHAGSSTTHQSRKSTILYGSSTITDSLCGLTFNISPDSFFQTNTAQSEVRCSSTILEWGCRLGHPHSFFAMQKKLNQVKSQVSMMWNTWFFQSHTHPKLGSLQYAPLPTQNVWQLLICYG